MVVPDDSIPARFSRSFPDQHRAMLRGVVLHGIPTIQLIVSGLHILFMRGKEIIFLYSVSIS